ncbi:MAG: hypothetical protein WCP98_19355, partial [Actinomycetes bacterium]
HQRSTRSSGPGVIVQGRSRSSWIPGRLEVFARSAHGAEVWTHDEHFRELPGVRFVQTPAPTD